MGCNFRCNERALREELTKNGCSFRPPLLSSSLSEDARPHRHRTPGAVAQQRREARIREPVSHASFPCCRAAACAAACAACAVSARCAYLLLVGRSLAALGWRHWTLRTDIEPLPDPVPTLSSPRATLSGCRAPPRPHTSTAGTFRPASTRLGAVRPSVGHREAAVGVDCQLSLLRRLLWRTRLLAALLHGAIERQSVSSRPLPRSSDRTGRCASASPRTAAALISSPQRPLPRLILRRQPAFPRHSLHTRR